MVGFSNCKINIGLYITEKRADGFHNLATVFYPIPIYDVIEIITQHNNSQHSVEFSSSGITIDVPNEQNICVKAYELLKKDFATLPAITMHLHKNIPTGAGLGGGSANAALVLQMLNTKFNLQLTQEQLLHYALVLGSDCPFFILNQPCFASSRGEALQPVELNLGNYTWVIVNPGIHVNTGWAFKQITPTQPNINLLTLTTLPIENWKEAIHNQFELAVGQHHPAIMEIKETLYKAGAVYAAMSGSGSTVYGIFSEAVNTNIAELFKPHYFVKVLSKQDVLV